MRHWRQHSAEQFLHGVEGPQHAPRQGDADQQPQKDEFHTHGGPLLLNLAAEMMFFIHRRYQVVADEADQK